MNSYTLTKSDIYMVVIFEKTRHVKNNEKSKKYHLRGERNVRYYDKVLSNKKKSYNSTFR